MIGLIKGLLVRLMRNHGNPHNRWTKEASQYLLSMDIEWQIILLEHCLELDCSRHHIEIQRGEQ